jgi:YggT family protein
MYNPIVKLAYYVTDGLFSFIILVMIAAAVLSWLFAFNVVNPRNPTAYQISRFLDAITAPILAPFRRIIPPLGNVDISFLVAFLVLKGIQNYILPWLFFSLDAAVRIG